MQLSIGVDISGALLTLNKVQRKQVPFAASKTLNQLAYEVARKEMPAKADDAFQGGATPYTKRGFRYKNSRKKSCLLYTSPSPRDGLLSRMPSSA